MTTWYVTMFSSKIKNLDLLYTFWLALLDKNDNLFISYFGVALLQFYKSEIQNQDMMSFPNVFKRIFIENYDQLMTILSYSESIMNNTPTSAEMTLRKYNMFKLENTEAFVRILEKAFCLLVLPREIIESTYPQEFVQQSSFSKHFRKLDLQHLLIDCRSHKEQKLGYFQNSELISKAAFNNKNKLMDYPKKYMALKRNCHITLMGSGDNDEKNENLITLYNSFINHDFPYISLVEGGYIACHDFAVELDYPIMSHNPAKCTTCDSQKKVTIETALDNFFKLNQLEETIKNEKVYKCSLSETNNVTESELGLIIHDDQILLCNVTRKEILDKIDIGKLNKISSNKTAHEILSLGFENSKEKKIFKLQPHEVKEFLKKIRESYHEIKTFKSNIKKLI